MDIKVIYRYPLKRWGFIKKSDIHRNFNFLNLTISKTIQQNIIILKYATIYHYSSTMNYGIGRYHKIGKQSIKQLDNTTDTSLVNSTPSYSYKKLNENTDITSKKELTAGTHYII